MESLQLLLTVYQLLQYSQFPKKDAQLQYIYIYILQLRTTYHISVSYHISQPHIITNMLVLLCQSPQLHHQHATRLWPYWSQLSNWCGRPASAILLQLFIAIPLKWWATAIQNWWLVDGCCRYGEVLRNSLIRFWIYHERCCTFRILGPEIRPVVCIPIDHCIANYHMHCVLS